MNESDALDLAEIQRGGRANRFPALMKRRHSVLGPRYQNRKLNDCKRTMLRRSIVLVFTQNCLLGISSVTLILHILKRPDYARGNYNVWFF